MKCSLGISNFLEEISSLSHSVVFLYFFALITEEGFLSVLLFGTLYSDGFIFPFSLCFLLLFFSQLFLRPPQKTILSFYISFSWGWSWSLPPVQCHESPFIVLQFSSVQLLSHVQLFVTQWIIAHQASLSITNSRSLLKLISIKSVMTSSHLFLCRPILLLPHRSSGTLSDLIPWIYLSLPLYTCKRFDSGHTWMV